MKLYKKPNGDVFAFESDGSQDNYIQAEMVEMSQAEIDAHLNPPKTQEQIDEELFQQFKAQKLAEQEVLLRAEYEAAKG